MRVAKNVDARKNAVEERNEKQRKNEKERKEEEEEIDLADIYNEQLEVVEKMMNEEKMI